MDKGMMKFEEVSKIANFLSRDYAADFLRLLVLYKTISASEAASLLEIHIKTAQDFLDGLVEIGILKKEQVFERKRPYFRYTLIKSKICIETDFSNLYDISGEKEKLNWKIREKNTGINTMLHEKRSIWVLAGIGYSIPCGGWIIPISVK